MVTSIRARKLSSSSFSKSLPTAMVAWCAAIVSSVAFGNEASTPETESSANRNSVFIETIVARVSSEDAAGLKINWGSGAGEPLAEDYVDYTEGSDLLAGTLDSSDLEAIGSKLSSESGSTLLITPTLYTFDGDEAGMFVGQEVPLESVQSQRDCLPESSMVSTDLTVNTDIESEAKILLDVALEISTVVSADAVEAQKSTNDCPPIFTEHIHTKVKGSDGDIVVLSKPAKGDNNSPRLMLFLKPKIGFRSISDKLPSIEELIKADKIVTLSD